MCLRWLKQKAGGSRGLVVALVVVAALMMGALGLYLFGAPRVIAFDSLAPLGGTAELVARVERVAILGLGRDLEGARVRFSCPDLRLVQEAIAGDEGIAQASVSLAEASAGDYQISVQHRGSNAQDSATLFIRNRDTPLLIVDIDGTISAGSALEVLFAPPSLVEPLPDAVEVLRSLSARYLIVYLTARKDDLYHRTEQWLRTHGFPRGPLVCRPEYIPSQFEFKRSALAKIKQRFPNIVAGVGNRDHDAAAYRASGIPAILIGREQKMEGVMVVDGWREIPVALRTIAGAPAGAQTQND